MKREVLFFLLVLVNISMLIGQDIKLANLKCDYQYTPLGIDNPAPSFSWQIVSGKGRDVYQMGYHILVASDNELLEKGIGDVWDSGEVESDRSVQVKYEGRPMESMTRYYWKVTVKTSGNKTSEISHTSFFETGLMEPSDWQGDWIAAPSVWDWPLFIRERKAYAEKDESPWDNVSPLFRKEFEITKKVKEARLYICGLGYYEAYINGAKVGDQYLEPAYTRFDKTALYGTYDITRLLSGQNAIGVMLGNGWYNMPSKSTWGFDHAPWRGKPRLIARIELFFDDGTRQTVSTDETWKCTTGPVVFNSLYEGTVYDARQEKEGWNTAGYNDGSWKDVFTMPSPGGVLKSQRIEPVGVYRELKPQKIVRNSRKGYLVDFGQNMAGWSRIKIKGREGDTITLRYGEDFKNDTIDQTNIGVYVMGNRIQTDQYILKGNEPEVFETKFTYHGFRYIEVTGYPGELTVDCITAVAANTGFEERGYFECSDPMVNKIQENTLWSFRSNYHSIPTDCPHREKNGWTGDAQIAVETGLWNFHANRTYAKYMDDLADEQQLNGNLPGIVPTSGWGYHWGNGPAWIGAYIIIPWYMYLYDGDIQTLARHYDRMKLLLSWFESKAEGYILSIGLGDWAPYKTRTPVPLNSTAYFYKFAHIQSQIAALLNRTKDADYYTRLANNIKEAFNREFYDASSGTYANGSQTSQSCALYMGLVDDSQKDKVLNRLLRSVKDADDHIDTGILGAKYLLHVLADNGHADLAYRILTTETFPGWGWQVKQGATTLWEDWDGRATKKHSSYNHIMYGDVSNWFYQYIAGITPDKANSGFRHFHVKPELYNKVDWCKAGFESEYGLIGINWRKDNRKFFMEIEVPCNTQATVSIPAVSKDKIKENGGSLSKRDIKVVEESGSFVSVKIGSGKYEFESMIK